MPCCVRADGCPREPADGEQGDVVSGVVVEGRVEEVIEELVEVGGPAGGGGGEAGQALVDGAGCGSR